jgi:AraC-like DNA-binding protein
MCAKLSSGQETPPGLAGAAGEGARRFFRAWPEVRRGRAAAGRFRVVGGGWEVGPAGDYTQRRSFPYLTIEYIVGGRGWVELGGRREGVGPDCVYAAEPDMRFGRRSDARRPLRRYYLWLEGAEAAALVAAAGLGRGRVRRVRAPAEWVEPWEWLLQEGMAKGAQADALREQIVRALLLKLADGSEAAGAAVLSGGAAEGGGRARVSFERCRELVEAGAVKLRNLGDIAAAAGLQRATVCRLFRRFADTTPETYLRSCKLQEAARRLALPGARVKAVAAELGFADAFHFSRVFRAALGAAPREYRARSRAKSS